MAKYVALLRGINVGGRNIIKMGDLCSSFESMGFADVTTYIQSGNVVFSASERNPKALREPIASMLQKKFGYVTTLVVLSKAQIRRVVEGAPDGFGIDPERLRYDVMFVLPPLTARRAYLQVPVKEGVDVKFEGKGVVYFTRLIAKASSSRLSRVTAMPIYQQMTIRNWKTTTTLNQLLR